MKYRDSPVDLGAVGFITVPLSPTGDVRQAWWDARNDYMVIDLGGTLYHYCAFGEADADALAVALDSHDHYQTNIRGTSDCRYEGTVPSYSSGSDWAGLEWREWSQTVHTQLSRDFDFDPELLAAQLNLITETLILFCTFFDGQEIDVDVLEANLRDQLDEGQISADAAWFRLRVAEEYNWSPDRRRTLCFS